MSAERRTVHAIGAQLHMSAAAVEALSLREVAAWAQFFADSQRASSANDDGAVPVSALSREQLRGMFHHGRR